MKELTRLSEKVLIVVCDPHKALLLKNVGSPIDPSLKVVEKLDAEDIEMAPDAERPGRRFDGAAPGGSFRSRSSMEHSDTHAIEADAFAVELVDHLMARQGKAGKEELLIAAPPAFLGHLRRHMKTQLTEQVVEEIPKRLTDQPVADIPALLTNPW